MIKRWIAWVLLLCGLFASVAKGADNAIDLVNAIYRKAVQTEGAIWIDHADGVGYLSKSLMALWAKADAVRPADDEMGPVDFDVVADTNGLTLSSFKSVVEREDATTAAVTVTLGYAEEAHESMLRYDLVNDDGAWKVDNIRARNWSLRDTLESYISTNPVAESSP